MEYSCKKEFGSFPEACRTRPVFRLNSCFVARKLGAERVFSYDYTSYLAEGDKRVPGAISSLFAHVVDIGLTVSSHNKTVYGLTYILKHQSNEGTIYSGWLGGLPATDSDVAVFEKDTNTVFPLSYRVFCGVHNGLLWNGNGGMGYLPIRKLIAWRNALGFCGDGAGNLQVFDLTKPLDNNDYLTCDWDHETDEFTKWMPFGSL